MTQISDSTVNESTIIVIAILITILTEEEYLEL